MCIQTITHRIHPSFRTSIASVLAYVLMLVVLDVTSPGVVTVTEAVITVLCFPLFVWVAWLQDIGFFGRVFGAVFGGGHGERKDVDNTDAAAALALRASAAFYLATACSHSATASSAAAENA